MKTVTLDRIRSEVDGDRVALVARIVVPHIDDTEVRLRVHAPELVAQVDTSATPFLPMMTLLAARLGTDLMIDAPVDELALHNAARAAAVLHDWWEWRVPRVTAAMSMAGMPPSSGMGLWYSRGVDSSDTLLRALAGELVEGGETIEITHLLGLDWIDPPYAVGSQPEIWSDTEEAAASLGLPLLRFTTDVRRVLEPVLPWQQSHGAVLGGLGLLLRGLLGSTIISATEVGDAPRPYGSHPALDPLWSSARTRTLHVGCDRERSEKVERVAQDQWALDRLKVCWEVDTPRNCGRCSKCLNTMTFLKVAGALDRCRRFDGDLSADAVWAVARSAEPLPTPPSTLVDILRVLPAECADLRAAWAAVQERLEREAAH